MLKITKQLECGVSVVQRVASQVKCDVARTIYKRAYTSPIKDQLSDVSVCETNRGT